MTQKHFIRIAAILKEELELADNDSARVTVRRVAMRQADYFAEINPNFKRSRFLTACGI